MRLDLSKVLECFYFWPAFFDFRLSRFFHQCSSRKFIVFCDRLNTCRNTLSYNRFSWYGDFIPFDYLFLAKRLIKKLFHLHQALLSVNHQNSSFY